MPYTLFQDDPKGGKPELEGEEQIFGVVVAEVVSNRDLDRLGMVQIRFPWLPGVEPWARVASFLAGKERGAFFVPQEKDEVLVAFNHGDMREPYVIGGLWNGEDKPPATELTDPVNKFLIRTPKKHEIRFDDQARTITITSLTEHRITLGSDKVEIVDDKDANHRITLDKNGITIEAKKGDIVLEAKQGKVQLKGQSVEISGKSQTELKADGECVVSGKTVRIN